MSQYTLFIAQLRTEFEDECRKDGGHLVSILSEKENRVVERIAASAGHNVWSGRYKPKFEKWRWLDNATWIFQPKQKCEEGQEDESEDKLAAYGSVSAGRERWPFNVLFLFFISSLARVLDKLERN